MILSVVRSPKTDDPKADENRDQDGNAANIHGLQKSDWLSWATLDQADMTLIQRDLAGRHCRVRARENDWLMDMGDGRSLSLNIPWRIMSDGHIALGSKDNGNWFGLAKPLDARIESRLLLGGKRLKSLAIAPQTADLTLHFDDQTRIDAFNDSSGYEGWRMRCQMRGRWIWVIGSGGGQTRIVFLDH